MNVVVNPLQAHQMTSIAMVTLVVMMQLMCLDHSHGVKDLIVVIIHLKFNHLLLFIVMAYSVAQMLHR